MEYSKYVLQEKKLNVVIFHWLFGVSQWARNIFVEMCYETRKQKVLRGPTPHKSQWKFPFLQAIAVAFDLIFK